MEPAQPYKPIRKILSSVYFFISGLLFFLGLVALFDTRSSGYSIFDRTWGFDHILFYGWEAKVIYLLLVLILLIPYSNKLLAYTVSELAAKVRALIKKKFLLFALVAILSSVIFYLFDVKYFFLGDFNFRLIQTMRQEFVATEYLTMKGLYHLATFGAKYGFTHEQIFKFYSYFSGGLFVFVACLIADLLGKNTFQKSMLLASQVCTAMVLVFCGYVEIYATPVLWLLIYVYGTLRYLLGRTSIITPIVFLLIACATHLICVAAIPSLIVVIYFGNKDRFSFITGLKNSSIALIISSLLIITVIAALQLNHSFLLAWSTPPGQPDVLTFLSGAHLWEIFNGQLLCCGLAFILVFYLILKSITQKIELDAVIYFLLAVSGCLLLVILVSNLQRGSGDWDLMAFTAVTLNLTFAYMTSYIFKNNEVISRYMLIAVIGINTIHTFLWLQINHTDRSIKKIETMLLNDPGTYYTARISGAYQLALAFKNNKLHSDAERLAKYGCQHDQNKNYKSCILYGQYLKDNNKPEEATAVLEDLLVNKNPYLYSPYLYLLEYYEKKGDTGKVIFYLNLLFDSFINKPEPFLQDVNFKKEVLIGLFEILDHMEDKANTIRHEQIKQVIDNLKLYK